MLKTAQMERRELYASPNTVRLFKSRNMRWAGHVARTGEKRNVYKILVGKAYGKESLGRPSHRHEDKLTLILKKPNDRLTTGFSWLKTGANGGLL
jgi:hypothetical protein